MKIRPLGAEVFHASTKMRSNACVRLFSHQRALNVWFSLPLGLLHYCERRRSQFDRISLKYVAKRNWRGECVCDIALLVHVTNKGNRYILLAWTIAKICRSNVISISIVSSETHMDAVEYLIVYFISESISESKLTKTRLFYADSKPTCAIHINFEAVVVRSCTFNWLGHVSSYIGSCFFRGWTGWEEFQCYSVNTAEVRVRCPALALGLICRTHWIRHAQRQNKEQLCGFNFSSNIIGLEWGGACSSKHAGSWHVNTELYSGNPKRKDHQGDLGV
jgi:hypothetical protein